MLVVLSTSTNCVHMLLTYDYDDDDYDIYVVHLARASDLLCIYIKLWCAKQISSRWNSQLFIIFQSK